MREDLDAGYLPSCVINLTIRFDESLQVVESPDGLSKAITSGEIGLRPEALARRQRVEEAASDIVPEIVDQSSGQPVRRAAPGRRSVSRQFGPQVRLGEVQVQRYDADGNLITTSVVTDRVIDPEGEERALTPLTFTGDGFTTAMSLVPKRGSFDLPGPRQAATFTLDFDYDSLPIDPRLVRAVGFEIHLGCVDPRNYGAGMRGDTDGEGRALSILPTRSGLIDPATGLPAPIESTLLFYGTADNWRVEWTDTGTTATITGRSIIGILLDGKPPVDVLKRIDLERPIHRVIADLIATIPLDQRLALDVFSDASEWPNGKIPAPGSIEGFTNVTLGASSGKPTAGGGGGTDRISYWDLITNLCYLVGGVPHLQGSAIWVRPGRSVFEIIDHPGRTPFRTDRQAADGKLAIRRLLIGRHIKRFHLERTFGGTPVPIVQAIGFDDTATGKDRIVIGQWPPKDSTAAKAKNDNETLRVPMPFVRDQARLVQIARDTYEEIGRGEIGGEFETATLASFGGGNFDPDLLRLRPLEPIEMLVDVSEGPTPIITDLARDLHSSFEEEVRALVRRIGDVDAARAIVAARRGAVVGVLDAYRVTAVRFQVDENGVEVSGSFQNYIVSRHGQTEDIARENAEPEVRAARAIAKPTNRAKLAAAKILQRGVAAFKNAAGVPLDANEQRSLDTMRDEIRRRDIAKQAEFMREFDKLHTKTAEKP